MNLRRTAAIARKEGRNILRDPRSLAMALAVPVLMLLLFGLALSLDVDKIPTMIYDRDQTAKSRELIQQFRGSRYFEIIAYTDNYKAIERAIDRNEIRLAVVIPPDYSRLIASGKTVGQIAKELSLSVSTVSTYRSRILTKMDLKNSAQLTHYAVQNGLVD